MLLLITGSADATADRIVAEYGEGVFRLNYDLWRDYQFTFSPHFWSIKNPTGLEISSSNATSVFWWKVFSYQIADDRFVKEEIKYSLRDLYGWFKSRGKAKGNFIDYHHNYGKMNILSIASEYFTIPQTLFSIGLETTLDLETKPLVTKSLSSQLTSSGNTMITTPVESLKILDKNFPWHLQEKIESKWDITIFTCNGKYFPFKRDRTNLKGIDWRAEQDFEYTEQEWFPFELTKDQLNNLKKLSTDLNIEFGRYDFMTEGSTNELIFLELNATGQWMFLDIHNEYGLLETVVNWLKS